jgi:hypothetical protein
MNHPRHPRPVVQGKPVDDERRVVIARLSLPARLPSKCSTLFYRSVIVEVYYKTRKHKSSNYVSII